MDLTIKKTGKTFFRVDDGIGFALCEALPEVFERYLPKPKAQPAPTWRLRTSDVDQQPIGLVLKTQREEIVVPVALGTKPDVILARCTHALAGRKFPLPTPELLAMFNLPGELVSGNSEQKRRELEAAMLEQNRRRLPDEARAVARMATATPEVER